MSKALHKILNVMTKLSYEKHLHGKGIGRHRHELLTIFIAFQNRLAAGLRAMEEALIKIPISDLIPPPWYTIQNSSSFIPHSKLKLRFRCILQVICVGSNIVLILKITGLQGLYVLVLKYFQWQCTIKIKKSIQFTICYWFTPQGPNWIRKTINYNYSPYIDHLTEATRDQINNYAISL